MNLKQQLKEKNIFLRKAYEVAYEYSPSNPLSVDLNPREFGRSIGFNDNQIKRIMIELVEDGYVQSSLGMNKLIVTRLGLEYLRDIEYESFTASMDNENQKTLITNNSNIANNYSISIINSPNSNIINQSDDASITQNYSEANKAVEKIREVVITDSTIDKEKVTEILNCLNEIQDGLKNNQKPKFAIKSLLDIASNISSIGSWLTTLGQFAGIIPIL